MPYDNWSEEAQVVADTLHVKLRTIHETLREVGGINFNIASQRAAAIDTWHNMDREFPVSHEKQFPEFAVYMNFETGDFARLEAQLLNALDLKEFSKHRDQPAKAPETSNSGKGVLARFDTGHQEGTILTASPSDDANVAFRNAIRNFKVQLGHAANLIGRKTFEARFDLKWR
jgi:hypothetical protein